MKYFLCSMLALLLLYACNTDAAGGKGKAAKSGSAAPAQPAGDSPEEKLLMNNFWVIEYYISFKDFEGGKVNRGRWYRFKPDGTFANGHWGEQTGYGTWQLLYKDGENAAFIIDSATDDTEDAGWEIQQKSPSGDEMTWVGIKDYATVYGDLVKAINLLTAPTKKQFGDE
jgi:hypothetical protein